MTDNRHERSYTQGRVRYALDQLDATQRLVVRNEDTLEVLAHLRRVHQTPAVYEIVVGDAAPIRVPPVPATDFVVEMFHQTPLSSYQTISETTWLALLRAKQVQDWINGLDTTYNALRLAKSNERAWHVKALVPASAYQVTHGLQQGTITHDELRGALGLLAALGYERA